MPEHEVRSPDGDLLGYWAANWHDASAVTSATVIDVHDRATGAWLRCRVLAVQTAMWQGAPAEGGVTVTATVVG